VVRERAEAGVQIFYLTGGSGFYARAALEGLYPVEASDPHRREALAREWEADGGKGLFAELVARDSAYAAKIGPADQRRVLRALEILRFTKFKTMKELEENLKSQPRIFDYTGLALFREREELRAGIRVRAEKMIERGLVDEVQRLLFRDLGSWAPLKSVGYAETVRYLNGELSRREFTEELVKNSARLAKRQMTWLRSKTGLQWFHAERDWAKAVESVSKEL
jgi:tRNA dimethylallyltransferase